jgi:hypothetical protein
MNFSKSFDEIDEQTHSEQGSDTGTFDKSTVDAYRRRNQILSDTHRTEWWMAIAVLLIIASVGFVVL